VGAAQTFPADPDWVAVTRGGTSVFDSPGDTNPASPSRDVVNTAEPSAYVFGDGTFVYFRVRVDGDPAPGGALALFGWGCEIDTDLDASKYEVFTQLNGNTGAVQVWSNASGNGTPTDPSETLVATYPVLTHSRVVSDGSSDYFVDWAVPTSALVTAGATVSAPVRLIFGTTGSGVPLLATGASADIAGVGSTCSPCDLASVLSDTSMCSIWTCTTAVPPPSSRVGGPSLQALPNPMREGCRFEVALPTPGSARITITDVSGRLIRRLDFIAANESVVPRDGRNEHGTQVRSGVYFVELSASGGRARRSLTIMR